MILTISEIRKLDQRIDEIHNMTEFCTDLTDYESDLLVAELETIIKTLQKSMLYARFSEKGLRIVK